MRAGDMLGMRLEPPVFVSISNVYVEISLVG
jgi:hypothetical protein